MKYNGVGLLISRIQITNRVYSRPTYSRVSSMLDKATRTFTWAPPVTYAYRSGLALSNE